MTPAARAVVAGGVGVALGLLVLGLSGAGLAALALGIGTAAALRFALPARTREGPSDAQQAGIDGLERSARALDKVASRIHGPEIRAEVRGIGIVLRDMAEKLSDDARPLPVVEELLREHAPRTLALAEKIATLAERPLLEGDDARQEQLMQAGRTLARVRRVLEDHYRRMLEQERIDLTVDRRIFEELLLVDDGIGEVDAESRLGQRETE